MNGVLAEIIPGSTSRISEAPCGKKKARPDFDEPPDGIFKTIIYLVVVGQI
jgi:hypothetical protein